jgi:hypothetical protein
LGASVGSAKLKRVTRTEAIDRLKAGEAELKRRGVAHAGIFGSVARGEAGPDSDVDVLIRFAPEASVTLLDYAAVKRRVAQLLKTPARRVDVIDLDGMSAHVRPQVERDAVYAF